VHSGFVLHVALSPLWQWQPMQGELHVFIASS
jgi:hypothetical protein